MEETAERSDCLNYAHANPAHNPGESFARRGLHRLLGCWQSLFPVRATNRKENHSASDRAKLPTALHFHRDTAVSRKLTSVNRAIFLVLATVILEPRSRVVVPRGSIAEQAD